MITLNPEPSKTLKMPNLYYSTYLGINGKGWLKTYRVSWPVWVYGRFAPFPPLLSWFTPALWLDADEVDVQLVSGLGPLRQSFFGGLALSLGSELDKSPPHVSVLLILTRDSDELYLGVVAQLLTDFTFTCSRGGTDKYINRQHHLKTQYRTLTRFWPPPTPFLAP